MISMTVYWRAKVRKRLGSPGRIRTCNPLFNSGESAGENKPPKWRAHAGQAPGAPLLEYGPAWLRILVVLACKLFRDLEFGSPDHYTKETFRSLQETAIRKLNH